MPTQNRRAATYLPKEIDDRLAAFKAERGIKGDSEALITILSEFFGVAHSPAQTVDYSGFVKVDQFQSLAGKVAELAERVEKGSSVSGLLSRLPDKMRQIAERLDKVEASTMLPPAQKNIEPNQGELSLNQMTVPGQMDLLPSDSDPPVDSRELEVQENSSSLNRSESKLLPMSGYALSKRFGLHQQVVGNNKNNWKNAPEKFTEWTKKKDPDGIPWQYSPDDKLYHPIVDGSLVDLSELPI